MIRVVVCTLAILVNGCVTDHESTEDNVTASITIDYQSDTIELLRIDRNNKMLEEQYLREIAIAQDNNDTDAYRFYLGEYVRVPRIELEEWMLNEPEFYPRKSAAQVVEEYKSEGN